MCTNTALDILLRGSPFASTCSLFDERFIMPISNFPSWKLYVRILVAWNHKPWACVSSQLPQKSELSLSRFIKLNRRIVIWRKHEWNRENWQQPERLDILTRERSNIGTISNVKNFWIEDLNGANKDLILKKGVRSASNRNAIMQECW